MTISQSEYDVIKSIPLPDIEIIDLIEGSKDIVFGTLFFEDKSDLKSQIDEITKLGLEYSYGKEFENIRDLECKNEYSLSIAVGNKLDNTEKFVEYIKNDNHKKMGEMLGYPDCCTEKFYNYFPDNTDNWTGTIISDYVVSGIPETENICQQPFVMNRMLRYVQEVLIYHFPCSLNCPQSIDIGYQRYNQLKSVDEERAKKIKEDLSSVVVYNKKRGEYDDILDSTNIMYAKDYDIINNDINIESNFLVGRQNIDESFKNKFSNISKISIQNTNEFKIDTKKYDGNDTYVLTFN